jgi:serine/threonine-protein kinase HipA
VKKLRVIHCGWGERWTLGSLADNGRHLMFEYTALALREGLQLSPLHLPLRELAYADGPRFFNGLPGLVADALPDGWGLLLMDRAFRKEGRNPATLSPLDRLAFVGERAIGALAFEPADPGTLEAHDVSLLDLARKINRFMSGTGTDVLRELVMIGGSPHGARPKALVSFDRHSGHMTTGAEIAPGAEPWLFKFPARGELAETCAVEELYARLARECSIGMPDSRFFELGRGLSAFGVRRFDRERGMRVPLHTMAGALHADYRVPSVDVIDFLKLTRLMTNDAREVAHAFARCVFNLLFNNRDDHAKNFSYRLEPERHWRLAPAYDLTFNEGPGGHHQLAYAGETLAPSRADLLRAAAQGGIAAVAAGRMIDSMLPVAARVAALCADLPIRKATMKRIGQAVAGNLARLKS